MMYSLTIPFSNETIDNIKLVEGEREEVEQQLDQRRIAMQEIRAIGRSAENSEIIIDAENDKVIVDNAGPIAVEVNDTLKVLIKSVLRNVKDIGYANENIIAMAISSTNKHCLLTEYANFYKTDSFGTIITSLIELGNTVFQNDNTLIHNVLSKQKLEDLSSGNYSKDKDSYDVSQYLIDTPILEYLKNLNSIKYIITNMNISLSRFGNSDVKENGSEEVIPTDSFKDWENTTITSLENKEVESFIRLVLELNKKFTTSIAMVYDTIVSETSSYGDEEISAAIDEIRIQYNLLCANSEFNLVSERTQALESYTNSLMAIEAFRDSKVGRILNFLFRMVKIFVKSFISYYSVAIRTIIGNILKLVSIINAKIASININERKQEIKSSVDKILFNENLDTPQFYVSVKNHGIIGYNVLINGLSSRVTRIPEDEFNIRTGRTVNIDELGNVTAEFTEKELSDGTKEASESGIYFVYGYIVPLRKIKEVIVIQEDIIGNLRDVIVDFLRDGKDDKLYIYADRIVTMLITISKSAIVNLPRNLNDDFRMIYSRKKCDNYRDILELLDKMYKLIDAIMGTKIEVPNVNSVFYDEKNNLVELERIYKLFGVSDAKIEREMKDIEKVLDRIDDGDGIAERARIAKIYTNTACTILKFVSICISNSVKLACRLERYKRYSDLINAKLINSIYNDISSLNK